MIQHKWKWLLNETPSSFIKQPNTCRQYSIMLSNVEQNYGTKIIQKPTRSMTSKIHGIDV